jgi:hypothetical protein
MDGRAPATHFAIATLAAARAASLDIGNRSHAVNGCRNLLSSEIGVVTVSERALLPCKTLLANLDACTRKSVPGNSSVAAGFIITVGSTVGKKRIPRAARVAIIEQPIIFFVGHRQAVATDGDVTSFVAENDVAASTVFLPRRTSPGPPRRGVTAPPLVTASGRGLVRRGILPCAAGNKACADGYLEKQGVEVHGVQGPPSSCRPPGVSVVQVG